MNLSESMVLNRCFSVDQRRIEAGMKTEQIMAKAIIDSVSGLVMSEKMSEAINRWMAGENVVFWSARRAGLNTFYRVLRSLESKRMAENT